MAALLERLRKRSSTPRAPPARETAASKASASGAVARSAESTIAARAEPDSIDRGEAGHAALDTFSEWKSIYVDYSGKLQRAQIDNQ